MEYFTDEELASDQPGFTDIQKARIVFLVEVDMDFREEVREIMRRIEELDG